LLAQSIDQKEHKDEQELVHKKVHQDTLKHVAKQWLVVKKRTVSENHAQKILDSFESAYLPYFRSCCRLISHWTRLYFAFVLPVFYTRLPSDISKIIDATSASNYITKNGKSLPK